MSRHLRSIVTSLVTDSSQCGGRTSVVFRCQKHFPRTRWSAWRYYTTKGLPQLQANSALPQTATVEMKEISDSNNKLARIDPLKHPDYFGVHKLFTVKDLFYARVHLGHKEGTLHENMQQFIFGKRLSHLVFDLDQTAYHMREALNFAAHIAYRKGIILFVNQPKQTALIVDKAAKECNEYSHTKKWHKGIFTNSTHELGGITRLPDLLIFLNTLDFFGEQHIAVMDAAKMLIPTIGIVDSNCDPNIITYPIPGNDDTPCAIELYCKLFKQAILLGKAKRKEDEEKYPDLFD